MAMLTDIRISVRSLLKTPIFAAISISSLAFGFGLNLTLFSAVKNLLFAPLPLKHGEQIAVLWEMNTHQGIAEVTLSLANFFDVKESATSFSSLAGLVVTHPVLRMSNQDEELLAISASPEFFNLVNAQPIWGRLITREDY